MEINGDFSQIAMAHGGRMEWAASPMAGVERLMFDRIGDEIARATSIVRFAEGSTFSSHTHGGGEEFLVLDGVFQDEHGDYPPGSYVRNPPGTSHTPGSAQGCTLFVKLWQFAPDDATDVRINTGERAFVTDPSRPGVASMPLFSDALETVSLETWPADTDMKLEAPGGLEVLVLRGSFDFQCGTFERYSWLRLPVGGVGDIYTGSQGVRVWTKSGHLRKPQSPPTANKAA